MGFMATLFPLTPELVRLFGLVLLVRPTALLPYLLGSDIHRLADVLMLS